MSGGRKRREEFSITGGEVLSALRGLLRAVTARGIALKSRTGSVFLRLPLWLGVAVFIFLPVWCFAAFIVALVLRVRIAIERIDPSSAEPPASLSPP
jgi:hypothetical protein